MNPTAIKKIAIIDALSQVPETHLDQVQNYLNDLLEKESIPQSKSQSLAGIWKNAGFEKIENLEEEIRTLRTDLQSNILNRKI